MMDLNTIWFFLIGGLFIGYAILDGFDLGVGIIHLTVREDLDRRIYLNSIAPVWDGNKVWLIAAGGSLFAAFPVVYATLFSGFYLALILLLAAFIFRATAIEFRSKSPSPTWRKFWDLAFHSGSTLIAFLLGVALGNILYGLPITAQGEVLIPFFALLRPYPILIGLTAVFMFALHGIAYLQLKTDGELLKKTASRFRMTYLIFCTLYVISIYSTLTFREQIRGNFINHVALFIPIILSLLAVFQLPWEQRKGRHIWVFWLSSLNIGLMLLSAFIGLYPRWIPAREDPSLAMTIYNTSSSPKTLAIMLVIILIGLPVILAYTMFVYRVFRGKVDPEQLKY